MPSLRGGVPIAVGVVVAVVAAIAAFGIIFATTWSAIHSGRTDRPGPLEIAMIYAVLLCAGAVPTALGFLAAWATRRVMGRKAGPTNSN